MHNYQCLLYLTRHNEFLHMKKTFSLVNIYRIKKALLLHIYTFSLDLSPHILRQENESPPRRSYSRVEVKWLIEQEMYDSR